MCDIRFIERLSASYTFEYDNVEYIHTLKPYECFQMLNPIPDKKLDTSDFFTDDSLDVFIDDVMNAFSNQTNRQIYFLESIYCLFIPYNFNVLYNKLDVLRSQYGMNDSIISLLLGRVLKVHECIDDRLVLYFTKLNVDEIPHYTFNFQSNTLPLILLKYIDSISKNEKPK
jgi:hypothetical protein